MSVYYCEPFFDETFSQRTNSGVARDFQPKLDIHESPEQNLVTAAIELPGLTKEQASIGVQNGRLIISGEQMIANDIEKIYTSRALNWLFPSGTNAKLENGALTITFRSIQLPWNGDLETPLIRKDFATSLDDKGSEKFDYIMLEK